MIEKELKSLKELEKEIDNYKVYVAKDRRLNEVKDYTYNETWLFNTEKVLMQTLAIIKLMEDVKAKSELMLEGLHAVDYAWEIVDYLEELIKTLREGET